MSAEKISTKKTERVSVSPAFWESKTWGERERGGGSRSPVALLLADHGAGGRTDSHRPRNHTSVTDLRRSRTRCSHDSRLKTTEEIGVGLSMGFLLKINLFTGPF